MKVILGLGNPGERYAATRHNVGFRVLDEIARRHDLRLERELCHSRVAELDGLMLVAPQTFMNRSGFAARCLADVHQLSVEDFLVVYDDVHLPLGTLRLRTKGSPGGQRGMESVIENLGSDQVARLRLGVGPDQGEVDAAELSDYVLDVFADAEHQPVQAMIERAASACLEWWQGGAEPAMQRFNGRAAPSGPDRATDFPS